MTNITTIYSEAKHGLTTGYGNVVCFDSSKRYHGKTVEKELTVLLLHTHCVCNSVTITCISFFKYNILVDVMYVSLLLKYRAGCHIVPVSPNISHPNLD